MQFSPLSQIKQRIQVGQPLPFNIRDHDGQLLLAQGRLVVSADQLQALLERGALVDIAELQSPADRVRQAAPQALPGLWADSLKALGDSLSNAAQDGFVAALDASTPAVLALIQRDPDLAIFQVLRQEGNTHVQYGATHSTHAAITGWLVAQRLGWTADDALRVFKAALTMNISMLELQGQLAVQTTPPTPEQREAIAAHPEFSRRMLELSGVCDTDWLAAVHQHHEQADGNGYPSGRRDSSDIAMLVRRADIYTAKLSPRAHRSAMAADKAGRTMFMQEPGHPMVAALVKEFGVYPPGAFVRLQSGASAIVVKRGSTVMTPIVALLTSPGGGRLAQPQRCDTGRPGCAVHSVLGGEAEPPAFLPEQLIPLMAD